MAGRRLHIEWRAEDTPETLKEAWQAEREPAVKMRLHGLWMLRRGMSVSEVARALDVHYRTVRRWVSWYRTGGLDEVIAHRRGGKGGQSRLSEEQGQPLGVGDGDRSSLHRRGCKELDSIPIRR